MSLVRAFVLFWYDFIVGDDWTVAVGVVAAFGATAILAAFDVPAWWLTPISTAALLGGSLWRAAR